MNGKRLNDELIFNLSLYIFVDIWLSLEAIFGCTGTGFNLAWHGCFLTKMVEAKRSDKKLKHLKQCPACFQFWVNYYILITTMQNFVFTAHTFISTSSKTCHVIS